MTIDDMHISVQQGVDKLHSQQADLLLPEEIDLEINKNIERFVKHRFSAKSNRYQEGFEESQKRIDDLRTLITESTRDMLYKGEVFQDVHVDYAEFPVDYLHLINLKSLVYNQKCKKFCSHLWQQSISPTTVAFNMGACGALTTYAHICFYVAIYDNLQNLTHQAVTIPSSAGTNTGTSFATYIQNPANWSHPGVTNISISGNIVLITFAAGINLSDTGDGYFTYEDAATMYTCEDASYISQQPQTEPRRFPCEDVDTTTLVGKNKFSQQDDIFALLSDPFNKSSYKSPLYTIRGNNIDVYTDDTFAIGQLKLTYLRRPATVILDTNNPVHCDLPEHTHQEVVDMTINSILEGISDPRYQSTNMEVLKSE